MALNSTMIWSAISVIISLICFKNINMMMSLVNYPYKTARDNSFYRLFSAGLIHADFLHLFINIFVFFQFGSILERYFAEIFGSSSTLYYNLLIILGILIPNLINYIRKKDDPNFRSLGFSGAVSAILFSYVLFDPLNILLIYGIIPMPAVLAAVLYVIYSIYANGRGRDNVDHIAHLSGAVTGLVFTILLKPSLINHFISSITSRFN